ncbi:MAG: hypothetical protein AVDCRST_MAG43-605 [uncultured Thermomicrobiales bacterium]|uniref:Glycosyl transferase, group 1 n=1 Tax=uncultured Thermomicrobiales bacterium TaxID=1645740 RepID=A0A6J4UC68_9BACT|nr:MAG: hypothetical protein AVDCRST_MAG43-605 [uncultured Thermomicrobiales bacterium]
MRIGINASLLAAGGGYRRTGVSRYIGELIDALEQQLAEAERLTIMGRGVPAIASNPSLRIAWEQTGLPLSGLAHRLNVFHGPLNVVPLAMRTPKVVTVHDLAFLRFPDQLPRARRAYMIAATRLSARTADRIIAVSQSTADDLMHWLDLPQDRITVIPEAPSPRIQRVVGTSLNVFRMRFEVDRPYILAVGTLEPRKNLDFFLRVFASVADRIPHELVLVGPEGWMTESFHQTLLELKLGDRIRLTGFVSDAELGGWYSGADVFVFPSTYEGFGLPAVEAMTCGVPILASDASCFPEVIGDAGMLVAPTDFEGWADALLRLVLDRDLNEAFRRQSREHGRTYSWDRTAAETLAIYRELAA